MRVLMGFVESAGKGGCMVRSIDRDGKTPFSMQHV
jgi:hypothetical protein